MSSQKSFAVAAALAGASVALAAQAPAAGEDVHRRSYLLGDFRLESGVEFIKDVSLTPIPSLWGHSAGSGGNRADNDFIDDQIRRFLER